MSTIVIVGAGIAGLGTALALGRQGQHVILCERDAAPVPATPEEMWSTWQRPGVVQARLGHLFSARIYTLLREHAPDVLQRLREGGTVMPGEQPLCENADLQGIPCRRPVLEGMIRQAVEAEPHVEVRAGCAVAGLVAEPSSFDGVPHVVGIRTRSGEQIRGDAVVIAGGRLVPVRTWLTAIGAHPPEEVAEPIGMVWYTRHFRLLSPGGEEGRIGFQVHDLAYLLFAIYELDDDTFAVDLGVPDTIPELRALHDEAPFMAVASSSPAIAPWITPERSIPIGPVAAMGGERNILRRFVRGGRPLALGLHVIGDARCQTHNLYGWGTTLALSDGVILADVLREHPHDPLAQAQAFEERTGTEIASLHALAIKRDGARRRALQGEPPWNVAAPEGSEDFLQTVVVPAVGEDPDIFRAVNRRDQLLDPSDALARNTAVLERARELAAVRQPPPEPPAPLGPTREELLQRLGVVAAGAART